MNKKCFAITTLIFGLLCSAAYSTIVGAYSDDPYGPVVDCDSELPMDKLIQCVKDQYEMMDKIHMTPNQKEDRKWAKIYSEGKYKHIGANICGNKIFLEELNQIFNSIIKTPRTSQRHVFDRGKFGSIHFGTAETCRQLYDYLYKDAHIFMKIKHDKFIEYLSRR